MATPLKGSKIRPHSALSWPKRTYFVVKISMKVVIRLLRLEIYYYVDNNFLFTWKSPSVAFRGSV